MESKLKSIHCLLLTGVFLTNGCVQPSDTASEPLDISNDHFIIGGPTESGYWKLDIKSGHGIYSSESFDAPLNAKFTGAKTASKIYLNNGSARLILSEVACENKTISGGYAATLELQSRDLSGCARRETLPDVRTISASGNEPFWNFRITGESAIYTSPELLEGITIPVTQTKDDSGTHYSGQLHGSIFTLSVSESACEDDMSGYAFPMTVRLRKGGSTYNGCARLD